MAKASTENPANRPDGRSPEQIKGVFHYTDIVGLLGILSSETLFATDYRYLNDLTEAALIRELLLPVFEAEIAEITPKLVKKGWLKTEFYTEHGMSGHRLQAEKLFLALNRAMDRVSPFFVLSFCRHDPKSEAYTHGLLSQWRGYGHNGGCAIEFDEQKLDALIKQESEQYAYAGLKSDDVRYEQHSSAFNFDSFKGIAGEMIREQFLEEAKIDVSEVTGQKDFEQAAVDFATTAPFLKHWGFSEEREYRIVGVCMRREKVPDGETREAKRIKFRAKNGLITPYIELFDQSQELPVKSIIVGPHPQQEKQAEAVRMALEAEYLNDVEVRLSGIPYRA